MTKTFQTLRMEAERIARAAGAIISSPPSGHITKSSRTDIATLADRTSEHMISSAIKAMFPHDAITGEEGTKQLGDTSRRWIFDPLDGTSNYVRGLWPSVISIAIEIDDRLQIGVVFDPLLDVMYSAAIGEGATRNGTHLRRIDEPIIDDAFVGLSGSNHTAPRALRANLLHDLALVTDSVRDIGSTAMHLCAVADGKFDAHMAIDVQEWDVAAGLVIASEAGCAIEGLHPNTPASGSGALVATHSLLTPLRALVNRALSTATDQ